MFWRTGTHDYSALLSIPSALEVWRTLGHERVAQYCQALVVDAAQLLCAAWATQPLVPLDSHTPVWHGWMVLVELPLRPRDGYDADTVQDCLYYDYAIEVPVKTLKGRLYVRISAHVYNVIADYQKLADAVLAIAAAAPQK